MVLADKSPLQTSLRGRQLLEDPFRNKGTAFTITERKALGLTGMLPTGIQTLDEQARRAYDQYSGLPTELAKNAFMTSMAMQNTVLFYRLLRDHLKEMFSVIYTPTEGDAIENYSSIFRKPEGCFLSIKHPEEVEERLGKFVKPRDPHGGIDYIVVSDGEEILGIGDQGVGGILISVAKLVLTTICAGIHPDRTLPVVLDTGTDNSKLLADELYLGHRFQRVRGEAYDNLVERFVSAARRLFPRAYIHFEDFGLTNARKILDKYRPDAPVFNDDIQGTGCVTLAAVMSAAQISGVRLRDLRVVVFGAGSAGCGIAEQIQAAMAEDAGVAKQEIADHIWCIDREGLLLDSMHATLSIAQMPFARKASEWVEKDTKSLQAVIAEVKPHVLIGTSTKPGAFSKDCVQTMARQVERPIIFPLSNPTRLHEAIPSDLIEWTEGRALVATGSPFDPVDYQGKIFKIAECNNSVCFPGIGLGSVLCHARQVTDYMLVEATKALAAEAPALRNHEDGLVPDVDKVRVVSLKIATAVVRAAVKEGVATADDIPYTDDEGLRAWVQAQMWEPEYRELLPTTA